MRVLVDLALKRNHPRPYSPRAVGTESSNEEEMKDEDDNMVFNVSMELTGDRSTAEKSKTGSVNQREVRIVA